MTQFDFGTIDPNTTSGPALATLLEQFRDALATNHSGATRPSYIQANQIWVDSSASPTLSIFFYDGTDDILIGTLNITTNVFTPGTAGTAYLENIGTSGNFVGKLNTANRWSAAQRGDVVSLTSAASITPDFSASNNFSLNLAHTATLQNPTNQVAGQSGCINIVQQAGAPWTLAYGANWLFEGGDTPALSTGVSERDALFYYVAAPGVIEASLTKNWS